MDRLSANPWRIIALVVITIVAFIVAIRFFQPPVQQPTQPAPGSVLLSDDFSSSGWGTATNAENTVEYVDGTLQMIVHAQNSYVWSPPSDNNYQNVHLEVTATTNDSDSTTAFGLICNRQEGNAGFYYFAVTPAGQYAIAKATRGESDVFLTNDDQWAASGSIPTEAASYRIGADCANGTLTLYVDGLAIDSVTDSSYAGGGVALFTWSGEEATTTSISFDDFLMTQLP